MKRLTITLAVIAVGALSACSPLAPPVQFHDTDSPAPAVSVDVAEAGVECPTAESCPPVTTLAPIAVIDPTSAEVGACLATGRTIEECAAPTTTTAPVVTVPVCDPTTVEGGVTC